jgi:hypothetical protein
VPVRTREKERDVARKCDRERPECGRTGAFRASPCKSSVGVKEDHRPALERGSVARKEVVSDSWCADSEHTKAERAWTVRVTVKVKGERMRRRAAAGGDCGDQKQNINHSSIKI